MDLAAMSEPVVTIRAAGEGDIEGVAAGYEWLFEPPGIRPAQWDLQRAAAALGRVTVSDVAGVLIAELNGELAGFCTVYVDFESVRFGKRAWVEDLAVHPQRRSLGIGKRLLGAAKDWARAHGAARIELESAAARKDAHRFYERETPDWRSACFGWEL
jgi:GNAT superfamily N-acetyltransferase